MAGQQIKLFLVDGTPGGLTTAEITNWTGHVLHARRSDLGALLNRAEAQRTGVYLLLADDPTAIGETRCYIGEADVVADRLRHHHRDKEFWDRAVVVTSKDTNLVAAAVWTTDIAGLDNKGLGRLRRVADPRDVWGSESGDFTPWLADNLDVLADELQMPLTLKATEVSVGDFRLDIQAETLDGRVVVIENQLERTDHGHMGQLLVYASGLEAAAVVWGARA